MTYHRIGYSRAEACSAFDIVIAALGVYHRETDILSDVVSVKLRDS